MNSADEHHKSNRIWKFAVAACLVIGAIRVVLSAFVSDIPLVGDEAFYWEWAQRPALSYYTKGPGIAWLIGVSTSIFGDTEFGVRAFAPLCGTIVAICAGLLAKIHSPRAGAIAASLVACSVIFQGCSTFMTIDGPYAACWALGCVAMHRAWSRNTFSSWMSAGLAVGVGFLFKYTILLLPVSWLLFATISQTRTNHPRAIRALTATLIAALCALPVIIWNQREGWPTLAHLLGHLGVQGGDMPVRQGSGGWNYSPLWTLSFIGTQIGLIGPGLLLGLHAAVSALRTKGKDARHEHLRYLACCTLPLFCFYLLVSFIAEPEGNWPMGAGITALALAGIAIDDGLNAWKMRLENWLALPEPRPFRGWWLRRPQSFSLLVWSTTLGIGVVTFTALPFANHVASLAPSVLPAARLTGARTMANASIALLKSLEEPGRGEPFLISKAYGVAAQMRFYMPGSPITYCSGKRLKHGRVTQYDYWPDTDLRDPKLTERNALAIGGSREDWTPFFDEVGEGFTLEGDLKDGRLTFACRGFKGVAKASGQ